MESALLCIGLVMGVVLSAAEAGPVSVGHLAEMPPRCRGHHYCTDKHDKYPDEEINNLLKQKGVSLGHVHEINIWRDASEEESQNDCKHNVSYSPIYEITDHKGIVRVVVQTYNFMQWFRIEECSHTGRLTKETSHFQFSHLQRNITCEQDTMTYSFLVLTRDGTSLESVRSGPIPVNCACRLYQLRQELH